MYVNEMPLILPGHSFEEGILKHEYLGSQRVIQDLKKERGWEQGFIVLEGKLAPKREDSYQASGLVQANQKLIEA